MAALSRRGLQPVLVHDGVEAILTIQRTLPRAVVLDAGLPKMFGFQVCELMKRNESLREIQVVLVGAIHHRDRYRRPPSEIYGADAYLERHQLRERLLTTLRASVCPSRSRAPGARPRARGEAERSTSRASRAREPRRASAPAAAGRVAPQSAAATSAAPAPPAAAAAEVGRAERLARIIVSDVVLYNEDKFDAAIRAGNVIEALRIRDGRRAAALSRSASTRACAASGTSWARSCWGGARERHAMSLDLDERDRDSIVARPRERRRRGASARGGALRRAAAGRGDPRSWWSCLGDASWRVRKAAVERLVACPDSATRRAR